MSDFEVSFLRDYFPNLPQDCQRQVLDWARDTELVEGGKYFGPQLTVDVEQLSSWSWGYNECAQTIVLLATHFGLIDAVEINTISVSYHFDWYYRSSYRTFRRVVWDDVLPWIRVSRGLKITFDTKDVREVAEILGLIPKQEEKLPYGEIDPELPTILNLLSAHTSENLIV